jgi:hypothetical protein
MFAVFDVWRSERLTTLKRMVSFFHIFSLLKNVTVKEHLKIKTKSIHINYSPQCQTFQMK